MEKLKSRASRIPGIVVRSPTLRLSLRRAPSVRVDPLERIAVDWNREAVAINRVNPLDLESVDQIHVVGGSPQAIPTEHDLV